MSLVTGQDVPPSLVDRLAEIATTAGATPGAAQIVRFNHRARSAQPQWTATTHARWEQESAKWLRDRWLPGAPANARSAFYAARIAEIRARVFPAPFWIPATLSEDYTEYLAPPEVVPYDRPVPPEYYDPLRRPSYCDMRLWTASYPTPTPPGTPSQPSPSWRGAVIDTLWRDIHWCPRRLRFELPCRIHQDDARPVALVLVGEINAEATRRGVRAWFSLVVANYFGRSSGEDVSMNPGLYPQWVPEHQLPTTLPPVNESGWSHQVAFARAVSGRSFAKFFSKTDCDRLFCRVYTPPSRGLYFGRNDDVEVFHDETLAVYLARGPDD